MNWFIRKLEDLLLPIRLYFGHKYMYDENRVVVKIWPNRIVKGPVLVNEYDALVYVATHTIVTVPKVYRTYHRSNGLHIEREFVPGKTLDTIWNSLAEKDKGLYIKHVWAQLEELRTHNPPPSLGPIAVASVRGGAVRDGVWGPWFAAGPFNDLGEFEELLGDNRNELKFPKDWKINNELRKTVFTNGDIAPRNIAVCREGDPSSLRIFDWDMSGWWPAYWESVKWHFGDFPTPDMDGWMEGWVEMMNEIS